MGTLGEVLLTTSDGCPVTTNLLNLNASLAIPTRFRCFEVCGLHRRTPVRPVRSCCNSVFGSSVLALWINQGTQWFSGEPLETPRTRCSLRQSPLMTWLPRSPDSTLVLRLNQEAVHDFILPFSPPCSPHLTPLATGSLERRLLVFSTPRGLTGNNLSRLFFTCTNASQAATYTSIVNRSSHQEATIHRSSNHTWSSISPLMSALTTHTNSNLREKKTKRNE
jgi:hypothetical protein